MTPLADKLRPHTLSDYIGQSHLMGENGPIKSIIRSGQLPSLIFWGPPGCGKTSLARLISRELKADFHYLSAVSAKKDDIRQLIKRSNPLEQTVLFLDEIHRFNKAQQDFLLPYVEDGTLTLIGATTENPSFEVIGPLLSRSHVYTLKPLTTEELKQVVKRAQLTIPDRQLSDEALELLATYASGDARKALNTLESAVKMTNSKQLTKDDLLNTLQSPYLRYDQAGDEHYDTISAFIKSMRASQADAALYYLARMIEAGEDPLFIARRMVIFASEDIGLAQPTALVVSNAVFRAVETIGYPECSINLAHGVAYLSRCKKDRSSNDALHLAQEDVRSYGNLEIPLKIRNAPTKLMKDLGYGKGYNKYDDSSYLPSKLKNRKYLK